MRKEVKRRRNENFVFPGGKRGYIITFLTGKVHSDEMTPSRSGYI